MVAPAMIGKLLISGRATASALAVTPAPAVMPLPVISTSSGMTMVSTSGGCTIGPNTLWRFTSRTASTHPTKKPDLNSMPGCAQIRMSSTVPIAVSTAASSTAPHSGTPLVPNAERVDQLGAPLLGGGALWLSRIAVTSPNGNGPVPRAESRLRELAYYPTLSYWHFLST